VSQPILDSVVRLPTDGGYQAALDDDPTLITLLSLPSSFHQQLPRHEAVTPDVIFITPTLLTTCRENYQVILSAFF
jgi:hypothetical protein